MGRLRTIFLATTTAIDKYKLWSLRLFLQLLASTRNGTPSAILASGPYWSPMIAAVAVGRIRRLPIVLDFRDPWVYEADASDEFDSAFRRWINRRLEHWCVAQAAAITCASQQIAVSIGRRVPSAASRIHCIRNGYDASAVIETPPPMGVLRLLFAGTIYFNRNPMPLLQGLVDLLQLPGIDVSKVQLTMVGECRAWHGIDLVDWCREHGLDERVIFMPVVSASEVRAITVKSNVLVNFAQGQKQQIPAKVFEQIASGRPVVIFAEPDSETALCVSGLRHFSRLDDDPVQVREYLSEMYNHFLSKKASDGIEATADIREFSRDFSNVSLQRVMQTALSISKSPKI